MKPINPKKQARQDARIDKKYQKAEVKLEKAKQKGPKEFEKANKKYGYNYEAAKKAGLSPDSTGHWPSRDPNSGLILKGKKHPTIALTKKGEKEAGYEIYKKDGELYSKPKKPSLIKRILKK